VPVASDNALTVINFSVGFFISGGARFQKMGGSGLSSRGVTRVCPVPGQNLLHINMLRIVVIVVLRFIVFVLRHFLNRIAQHRVLLSQLPLVLLLPHVALHVDVEASLAGPQPCEPLDGRIAAGAKVLPCCPHALGSPGQ
jgi:hypothetical protein